MASFGMASLFFIRYKRTVFDIFALSVILTFIFTLFVPYTYQAEAVVALPAGNNSVQEVGHLLSPNFLPYSSPRETHCWVLPAPNGKHTILLVEAGTPEFTADYANAWAEKTVALYGDPRFLVRRALVPDTPVRPKHLENMILGSVFGLMLGLVCAFFRALIGDMIKATRREKTVTAP